MLACSLFAHAGWSQAPYKFNYQGIARDAKGNPFSKKTMTIRIQVLPAQDATVAEYEETQTITTNEFGLYTLQIGAGTVLAGSLQDVKWETGNKYIQVAIDPAGGQSFTQAGTTQLLSVPYALYADKAGMAKTSGGSRAGNQHYLSKFDASGSSSAEINSQLFDNGTNIGIGTTSPAARVHVSANTAAVTEHIRMQNLSTTGAGRFTLYSDAANNYSTFTKYGSAFAGGYAGVTTLYPYANLLAFGNNGLASGDGLGRFLISTAGNAGISLFKSGTSKLKFHADFTTENVGIGGNSAPVTRVHLNNTDGATMDLRLTNNTTGHTANDGLEIRNIGNAAGVINKENADLNLGTNNTTRIKIESGGNVGINSNSVPPSALLEVKSTTQGFLPPVMTETQMNAIASPAQGLVVFNSTTSCLYAYTGVYWKPMCVLTPDTVLVNYTGSLQNIVAPPGYTVVEIHCYGAQGGTGGGASGGIGGFGAYSKGEMPVLPGTTFNVVVGESPTSHLGGYGGGANGGAPGANGRGGGGGGASYVTDISSNVLILAGGGGGGGGVGCEASTIAGGAGGVGGGGNGANGQDAATSGGFAGGGIGAIGATGGGQGVGCAGFLGQAGTNGTAMTGGIGGNGQTCCCFGTHSDPSGGGGGGGLIGGGGGGGGSAGTSGCSGNDKGAGGGGAGGTSTTGTLLNASSSNGVNIGNGYVMFIFK